MSNIEQEANLNFEIHERIRSDIDQKTPLDLYIPVLSTRSKLFWLALFLIPAILIFLFWSVAFNGEITGFFRIGAEFPKSPFLNLETALIVPDEVGHDGQMFLSMAFDPALQHPGTVDAIDLPNYRYRRIFYPVLGYLFGLGKTALIPYALVFVNYLAIVAIVYIGSVYLEDQERNPNHALWLLGIPALWITLSLGTAELVSSAFLVASLYFYRRRTYGFSAITIAAGCLTRETLLIVWISLVVAALWERIDRLALVKLGSACIPFLLWSFYVKQAVGSGLGTAASNNLYFPFLGILEKSNIFFNLD
ncbi:AZOBR_p60025 family cell surface glycopolymer formation protein [[Leptolyngbya] sp. PCC 7376]|uniref:AZOBR_p60025 family cell surface glycopolymer formation protein n=1 Tax=[Leptolyngbya] sp. PCC 7376 TaxID=111781 RepID=UPI0006880235